MHGPSVATAGPSPFEARPSAERLRVTEMGQDSSSAPIGLGIAGLGMAGAVMVQAAAAHPGYIVRAAAEPHAAPRKAFARDFNASAYADVAELVADPAVEAVYVATP